MEHWISVWIFRPKYVDNLQRWSWIFRSEETETDLSIWIRTEISVACVTDETKPRYSLVCNAGWNVRSLWHNGKHPKCPGFYSMHGTNETAAAFIMPKRFEKFRLDFKWKGPFRFSLTGIFGITSGGGPHGCFPSSQTDRSEISGNTWEIWNDIFQLSRVNQ